MNILLLGIGGRELALAWKIQQSKNFDQLYFNNDDEAKIIIVVCPSANDAQLERLKYINHKIFKPECNNHNN